MTRDTHVLGERGVGPKSPIPFSLLYGMCIYYTAVITVHDVH